MPATQHPVSCTSGMVGSQGSAVPTPASHSDSWAKARGTRDGTAKALGTWIPKSNPSGKAHPQNAANTHTHTHRVMLTTHSTRSILPPQAGRNSRPNTFRGKTGSPRPPPGPLSSAAPTTPEQKHELQTFDRSPGRPARHTSPPLPRQADPAPTPPRWLWLGKCRHQLSGKPRASGDSRQTAAQGAPHPPERRRGMLTT